MNVVRQYTDNQIRALGWQAIQRELGVVGMIRFMQQFDLGSGDYVHDRDEWQHAYTVETLAAAIQRNLRQEETSVELGHENA